MQRRSSLGPLPTQPSDVALASAVRHTPCISQNAYHISHTQLASCIACQFILADYQFILEITKVDWEACDSLSLLLLHEGHEQTWPSRVSASRYLSMALSNHGSTCLANSTLFWTVSGVLPLSD